MANDANDEATLQFLPIYHLVNGRYDRIPQAALHHLRNGLKHALNTHRTVFILINMGLHYVDNPVAGFTKDDYYQQMTTVRTIIAFLFQQFLYSVKIFEFILFKFVPLLFFLPFLKYVLYRY